MIMREQDCDTGGRLEMSDSAMAALEPEAHAGDDAIGTVARLEADLNREIALREAAVRARALARDEHEDAYEHLLLRCRSLEAEKVRWADAGFRSVEDVELLKQDHARALARQSDDLSKTFEQVSERVELKHRSEVEQAARDLAALRDTLAARDTMVGERDAKVAAAEEREGLLRLTLAEAEERFRSEAFHLSALIALRSSEAKAAQAEAEAAKRQLASIYASTSWKVGRPLRWAGRLLRGLRRVPSRLVGVVRHRP